MWGRARGACGRRAAPAAAGAEAAPGQGRLLPPAPSAREEPRPPSRGAAAAPALPHGSHHLEGDPNSAVPGEPGDGGRTGAGL